MNLRWLIAPVLLAALALVAYFWGTLRQAGVRVSLGPNASPIPLMGNSSPFSIPFSLPFVATPALQEREVIADNLSVPWEIAWLPDGSMLLTERAGRLLHVTPDGTRTPIRLPASVTQVSESGLLGLALHPNFIQHPLVYVYFTTGQGNSLHNRVVRYQLTNNTLVNEEVLLNNIPAGNFHDGGRIKFGPDGFLYVATGDAGQENLAQNPASLAGKILRIGDGGGIPADNPFGNSPVYSLGHRNVQGLAWDQAGNLWATEHGRSGLQSGFDELNLIRPGQNYGWPNVEGDEIQAGFTAPAIHSGANETWAPSGAAFRNGSVFFVGLRGETLYEAVLNGENVRELKRNFAGEFGRLRSVNIGPDGALYILTNNTDGRGRPRAGDDKLIRLRF